MILSKCAVSVDKSYVKNKEMLQSLKLFCSHGCVIDLETGNWASAKDMTNIV